MKFSSKKLLAVAALPMMLAACTTTGDNAMQVTPTDLQHHNWELAQIDGKDIEKSEHQATPRLEIGEKMTANGMAGCNNFFGQGELKRRPIPYQTNGHDNENVSGLSDGNRTIGFSYSKRVERRNAN